MSSTGFNQIRRRTNAQTHINTLIKEFNRFQAEQIQVDNPDFITNNRVTNSRLKYHDNFITHKIKPVTTQFYLPYEPDANHVVILCKMDHNGRYAEDSSGFGNHGRFINNPIMKKGLDLGYGDSLYAHFNGFDNWVFWMNNTRIDAKQIGHGSGEINPNPGIGATFTCRIYPEAIDDTDPDINLERWRTLISKSDDDTEQDGYRVALVPDGSIRFTFARDGIKTTVGTPAGVIKIQDPGAGFDETGFDPTGFDTDLIAEGGGGYDLTAFDSDAYDFDPNPVLLPITYELAFKIDFISSPSTPSKPILSIIVHDVQDHAITKYTNTISTHLNLINFDTNHRLRLGAFTPFFDQFYKYKGGIQDFRYYKELLLTDNQINNLFTNKWTINDIPEGHVAFSGYTVVLSTAQGDGGFSQPGFESNGFEEDP